MAAMRGKLVVWVGLIVFLVGGYWLDRCAYLQPLRGDLRTGSIPTALLDYGGVGKIIRCLGLVRSVPNDFERFSKLTGTREENSLSVFQRKRQVGSYLYEANVGGAYAFPSSAVLDGVTLPDGWPVVSIVAAEDDLHGPQGIMENTGGRGREWERPATVSYYEDDQLLFATQAGLRLHGGKSRKGARSFRLYFRRGYGLNRLEPGMVFDTDSYPVKRLVVRYDAPQYALFGSCFALDIAEKIGCTVPANKPALCYLNGRCKGVFFLSEHLSRTQWNLHFGHNDFALYRHKVASDVESKELYGRLNRSIMDRRSRMTMRRAGQLVDLDKLSRFIISIVFCGTTDGLQGIAVRDLTVDDTAWSWVNWDMDHSFVDVYLRKSDNKDRKPWEQDALELVFFKRGAGGTRTLLFTRLLREDKNYLRFFNQMLANVLNHELTREFFESRLDYYERLARSCGQGRSAIEAKRLFVEHRPAFVRGQMQRYLGLSDSYLCEVKGPGGVEYSIDGYPEKPGYRGYYFKELPIKVEIVGKRAERLSHWLVNGATVPSRSGNSLLWSVTADTVIEPVMQ